MGAGTPVKIAVVGAAGRMGREIIRAAVERDDTRVFSALERQDSPAIGKDAGTLSGGSPLGLNIKSDLDEGFHGADVVVDLSAAEATLPIVNAAMKNRVPLLCGTTGLDAKTLAAMEAASQKIALLHTPNLSLGIATMRKLVFEAVRAVGENWDIEIVEMHHRLKVDAPSGTAMALAETVANARGVELASASRFGREGRTGQRTASEIGIHAVRGGGVFGWHEVILAGDHETLTISHRASSRALFAEGALHAAVFLGGKAPGRYTMADLLRSAADENH